jgi:hypothetical protein
MKVWHMLADIPHATGMVERAKRKAISNKALPIPTTSTLHKDPVIDKSMNEQDPFSSIELALAMFLHDSARAEQYTFCKGLFDDKIFEHGDRGAENMSAFFELMHLGQSTEGTRALSGNSPTPAWSGIRNYIKDNDFSKLQAVARALGTRFTDDGTSGKAIDWEATRFAVYAHNKFKTPEELYDSYIKERITQIKGRMGTLRDLLQSSPDNDNKGAIESLNAAYEKSLRSLTPVTDGNPGNDQNKKSSYIRLARIVRDVDCIAIAMDTLGGIKDMTKYNIQKKYPDDKPADFNVTSGLIESIRRKVLYQRRPGESSPTDLTLSMLNCTLAAVTPEVYKLYLTEIPNPDDSKNKIDTVSAVFKLAADIAREKCTSDGTVLQGILRELHAVKDAYIQSVREQFGLDDEILGRLAESIQKVIDVQTQTGEGQVYP